MSRQMTKIMIDPGHGGIDPGAVFKYYQADETLITVQEKDVVLDIAQRLKASILDYRPTWEVGMTRTGDTFLDLEWIAQTGAGKDIFLSIHCNASGDVQAETVALGTTRGAQSLIHKQKDTFENRDFADSIRVAAKTAMGSPEHTNKIVLDFYRVLNPNLNTARYACIIEVGYLDNGYEIAKLDSPSTRQYIADCIRAIIVAKGDAI